MSERTHDGPPPVPPIAAPLAGSIDGEARAGAAPAAVAEVARSRRGLSASAWAWVLMQGGRDPWVILVTIYIFAPYYVTTVVGGGDPARMAQGQAIIANTGTLYGLFVALTAPVLGAMVNGLGPRKPLLALCVAVMAPLMAALWWIEPGGAGLPAWVYPVDFAITAVLINYADMLHNSLLTRAASPREAPHASGAALAAGNFFSVLSLVLVLWAFALPGKVDWPLVPHAPLFGLSSAKHEPDRIVGPISAILLVLGAIPFFLLTPDEPRTTAPLSGALRAGLGELRRTLGSLKRHRDLAVYLGARMLYTDGKTSILLFGGVYAAGVMGWHALEMLAYGILLSIFAVGGGVLAGVADERLGPKRAIQLQIAATFVIQLLLLGMSKTRILFFPYDVAAHPALWNGPLFRTLPEVVYLALGCGIAVSISGAYASSRTLLTRLAPPDQIASFFGLYALSGTATMWLGSALVGLFTSLFGTLQAGFAPISGLLVLGFLGMLFVRGGGRETAAVSA